MQQILIDDIAIDVVRKDIRHMHLCVYAPEGKVRISAPLRLDDARVREFAVSKLAWIKKHQQKQRARAREPARHYINGEQHFFLGRCFLLNVIENSFPSRVVQKDSTLDVHVNGTATREKTRAVLEAWYRQRLKEMVPEYVKKWEERLGVKAKHFGIKKMKTRWGTCSTKAGRIWLNLELARRPVEFLDYIVLHEVLHLRIRNHNEKFKAYLDNLMPQWRFFRKELNQSPLRPAFVNYGRLE
jgi:predicted metal-dependent hydrolase